MEVLLSGKPVPTSKVALGRVGLAYVGGATQIVMKAKHMKDDDEHFVIMGSTEKPKFAVATDDIRGSIFVFDETRIRPIYPEGVGIERPKPVPAGCLLIDMDGKAILSVAHHGTFLYVNMADGSAGTDYPPGVQLLIDVWRLGVRRDKDNFEAIFQFDRRNALGLTKAPKTP